MNRLANTMKRSIFFVFVLLSALSFAALSDLSDNFQDPDTISNWNILYQGGELIDIGFTNPARLTIQMLQPTTGWYQDGVSPFLYKTITGNFMVTTYVNSHSALSAFLPPGSRFNGAGLLVRNPASVPGNSNWIMLNVGTTEFVGSEDKTTVNSNSVLNLQPGANSGLLRVCRVGNDFGIYRFLDDEIDWTLLNIYSRPDLPQALQVGIMAQSYQNIDFGYSDPPDLTAEFSYVNFEDVNSRKDCIS